MNIYSSGHTTERQTIVSGSAFKQFPSWELFSIGTGFKPHPFMCTHEAMGSHDYNKIQLNVFCVVFDSNILLWESGSLTNINRLFPAVYIHTSIECLETFEKGRSMLANIDKKNLLNTVRAAVVLAADGLPVFDCQEGVTAEAVRIILSCIGIVNRMVWEKCQIVARPLKIITISKRGRNS